MSAVTVEIALQMGREKVPLRLKGMGRVLVLSQPIGVSGVAITIETGGPRRTAARTTVVLPFRPQVCSDALYAQGSWYELIKSEPIIIVAWLNGHYGAPA